MAGYYLPAVASEFPRHQKHFAIPSLLRGRSNRGGENLPRGEGQASSSRSGGQKRLLTEKILVKIKSDVDCMKEDG